MKILIISASGIGNTILATPLIQAIRRIYTAATIDVLVHRPAAELLENWPVINSIYPFDTAFPAETYDLALLCEPASQEHRFVAKKALRPVFVKERDFFNMHELEINSSLARELGYSGDISDTYVNAVLPQDIASYEGKIIVHPGSQDSRHQMKKHWPKESWVALIQKLNSKNVILIGGQSKADIEEADYIAKMTGARNDCGKHSLSEIAGLLRKASVFITTDSGPMHIAAACGTPIVALFGPTLITKNHPWVNRYGKAIVIKVESFCSPCHGTYRLDWCQDGNCMAEIRVEDILCAIDKLQHLANGEEVVYIGKYFIPLKVYKTNMIMKCKRHFQRWCNQNYTRWAYHMQRIKKRFL